MKKHTVVNPKHYQTMINGRPVQVVDIIEAFVADDAHLAQALKYLLRAGRKPEAAYIKDVGKALWWLAKALMFHNGEIELPSGCKITTPGKVLAKKRAARPVREGKTRGDHK